MSRPDQARRQGVRHWLGFLASGGLAFVTNSAILLVLTRQAGIGPIPARVPAILAAIVVGWLAHRTWTFRVATRPSLAELARYTAVQSLSIAVNFILYAAILLLAPSTAPLVALVLSSAVAMIVAYLGMRLGVFGPRDSA